MRVSPEIVHRCEADVVQPAEGSIWPRPLFARSGRLAGVPSPGHAPQGWSQEPKRAPDLLLSRGGTPLQGLTGGVADGSGAVVETHSTGEGGEPQGSRKGRPRDPLKGRGCRADVSVRRKHSRDSELGCYVHNTRPIICPKSERRSLRRGGESA